jgi:LacI family transcriptional regulator
MTRLDRPTLEDVARLAGVSTASISRALNAPDKVAPATLARIDAAIEALGYTPNFGGRALASSRTNTVGAVIPSMANAMFASALQAFQEELAAEGVTLLVATTGFDPEQELRQIKALVAQGADGLMLIGNARLDATWEFLEKRRVAHVVTWCNATRPGHLFVGFDNEGAAADAALRVMALGHRRLAMICGLTALNDRARARRDGVRRAVAAFGQGARLIHELEASYLLDHGAEAMARILAHPERPTAVLCGNDVLAAGAMMEARAKGIALPEELSVVGFDDIGIARVVTPPLATVRVPQLRIGQAAARLLLARLRGDRDLGSAIFETEFIHRASLAVPGDA